MSLRIDVEAAREYFAHPSQTKAGKIAPDELPDDGVLYFAKGGICVALHKAHWPGVWMSHYGVKPEAWGNVSAPAIKILETFWRAENPSLIVGWTDASNRAAISFARRVGFVETGRMTLPTETVIQQSWRPSWA